MSGRNPALTDWATPGRLWEKSNISTVCGGSNEPQPFTKGIYQFVLNNGVFADVSYTGWKSVATLEAFKMLARLRPPPTTSMAQFWGPFTTSHNTARQRRQHCKLEKSSSSSSRTSPEGEIKSQTPLPSCSWARSFLRKSAEKKTTKKNKNSPKLYLGLRVSRILKLSESESQLPNCEIFLRQQGDLAGEMSLDNPPRPSCSKRCPNSLQKSTS